MEFIKEEIFKNYKSIKEFAKDIGYNYQYLLRQLNSDRMPKKMQLRIMHFLETHKKNK